MTSDCLDRISALTDRQREILALIGEGLSSAEIAKRLHRTTKTIESHRLALGKKLGVRNRVELALIAVEAGLAGSDRSGHRADNTQRGALRSVIWTADTPAERALRLIDSATAEATGEAFLQALVAQLVEVFGARCAFIARLDADGQLRSVALRSSTDSPSQIEYPFAGSPCESLGRAVIRHIPAGLQEQYAHIAAFREIGADGLLITPLTDSRGSRIGTLALTHGENGPDESLCPELILRVFAGRVAAEMERLKQVETLRESERRYRLLAEYSTDLITQISPEGDYQYVSPASRQLLGYQPSDMIGRSALEFVHPEDRDRMTEIHRSILHERNRRSIEVRRLRYDGTYRWFEDNVYADRGSSSGKARWVNCVCRDVDDRKRAERELRKSEQLLKRAQHVAHVGSWHLDIGRNVLTWSDETCRIFGMLPGTELTYERFLARVHPDDHDTIDRAWKAALRGEPYDLRHRILADGQVRWVRERAEITFDDEGTAQSALGTVQDITRRIRDEEELKRKQMMLAHAELIAGVGSWEYEVDSGLVHGSDGLCRLLLVPKEKFPCRLDEIVEEVVHPDDQHTVRTALQRTIDSNERFDCHIQVYRFDGVLRVLHGQGIGIRDTTGRLVRVIGISQDVTEASLPHASSVEHGQRRASK